MSSEHRGSHKYYFRAIRELRRVVKQYYGRYETRQTQKKTGPQKGILARQPTGRQGTVEK